MQYVSRIMAISIKDPDTDRLARELAAVTGESLTEAIRIALAERLERHQRPERRYPMREAARRIQERLVALPVVDPHATGELTYDEYGLPA
jgi:antitoxin VapB